MTEQEVHETTWRDIARAYRQIIEHVAPVLVNNYGIEGMPPIINSVQAIDAEAELLAAKESTS